MARKVKGFPAGSKAPRYPDEWFDGSIWEIVPGEDLRPTSPRRALRNLQQAARTREMLLQHATSNRKVYIRALPRYPKLPVLKS
jgi:hypothetical protein